MFYIAKKYNNEVVDVVIAGHPNIAKAYWQGKGTDYDKIEETMNCGQNNMDIFRKLIDKGSDILLSGSSYSKTVVMSVFEIVTPILDEIAGEVVE